MTMRIVGKEMLIQRGYVITEETEEGIVGEKDDKIICLFFTACPKFNTEIAQMYMNMMHKMDIKHGIIVYKNSVTSSAKKIIENLSDISLSTENSLKIELFSEEELTINITKHVLQPTFERLSEDKAKEFKKKYGIKFAILLKSDPISKFYGYEIGDVIKITRKGYVTWRIVR
jgi:DNA-directed RNA polymerase I, II, and III subunit RPABC1